MAKTQPGFTLDSTEFLKNFKRITEEKIPKNVGEALEETWPFILADAIEEEPRVPHDTGNLVRSQKVGDYLITHDGIKCEGGFNAEYAGTVHEAPETWNWTEPGSGPKFLQTKLARNNRKYMKEVADRLRKKAK